MARHHHYSKRSRESRKAMTDGGDAPDYPDVEDTQAEDWQAGPDESNPPPGSAG